MNAAVDSTKFGLEQNNYVDVLVSSYESNKQSLIDLHNAYHNSSSLSKSLVAQFSTSKWPSLEKTLHLLNVHYWGEVYHRSNIATFLDAEKRAQWSTDLYVNEHNKAVLPEFNHANILSTLANWSESRTEFFTERVDLVFRSLSKSHVTNEPQGFSKKMIFTNACDTIFSDKVNMSIESYTIDILYDLACVIAVILNIPAPSNCYRHSFRSIKLGEKHAFFGGSFEVQVFRNGNLHVWVHPEIAIDLNLWLAKKYPAAIASEFRTKPKKVKEFSYSHDYLTDADFELLELLARNSSVLSFMMECNKNPEKFEAVKRFAKFTGLSDKEVSEFKSRHSFDKVATQILRNGYPNIKDHQFFPTPLEITESIAEHLANNYSEEELANKVVLEPSAGTGKLALIAPNYPTQSHCVEVSLIFCRVLRAKGLWNVVNADFMKFKPERDYDLVLMNPPYMQKQLETHLAKALSHLSEGGELIAVIPKGKVNTIAGITGFEGLQVISSHNSAFEDTKIETVVISVIK